jgi:hypothetical protein
MIDLTTVLSNFTPMSLEAMDHVKLLNRVDTKYVLHENQLIEILATISKYYNLLVIKNISIHPYETLYYDTPDLNLYQMHHNGILNRYKLRFRKYVNSGISYFEIKTKTNTNRTIKKRIQVETITDTLNEPLNQYISDHTPGEYHDYVPSLRVFFDRLTFVNTKAKERLTFDMNLRYISHGIEKQIEKIVIVEVKQEKHCISPFVQLMKVHRQPKNYLSKYCIGVTCLNHGLKRNRFKQKIKALIKLGYDLR